MLPDIAEGSRGPAIVVLFNFLAGVAITDRAFSRAVGYDNPLFDEQKVRVIRYLQAYNDLATTGNCDAKFQDWLKVTHGYELEKAANAVGGTNLFVQPDGSRIIWPQKTMPDRHIAEPSLSMINHEAAS